MLVPLHNLKGKQVGSYERNTSIYYTDRDWDKNQIYKHIANQGIAVDIPILKKLSRLGCKYIVVRAKNLPKQTPIVFISIGFKKFLIKSVKTNFDLDKNAGPQRMCEYVEFEEHGQTFDLGELNEKD